VSPSTHNPFAEPSAPLAKKPRARRAPTKVVKPKEVVAEVKVPKVPKVAKVAKPAKATAQKKPKIAVADPSATADVSRNHLDWLVREDDAIMDSVMDESSTVTLFDLAAKFKRDALLVARHILEGDIPEMAGLQADQGTEEEAEFLGLVLGGSPIALALKWCSATEEQEDRPTADEVMSSLTRGDQRGAMNLVRESGIWFSSLDQLDYLTSLEGMEPQDVKRAVGEIFDRIEAPTPKMVFEQLCGLFEGAPPVNLDSIGAVVASTSKGSWKTSTKKSRTKSTSRVIKAGEGRKATSYKRKSSSKRKGSYSGYTTKTKSKRYSKKRSSFS
jgi:hypothetical protein